MAVDRSESSHLVNFFAADEQGFVALLMKMSNATISCRLRVRSAFLFMPFSFRRFFLPRAGGREREREGESGVGGWPWAMQE
jgi:hypothetical protein